MWGANTQRCMCVCGGVRRCFSQGKTVLVIVIFLGLIVAGLAYQIMRYTPPEEVKLGRRSKRLANYKRSKRQAKEDMLRNYSQADG